MNLKVALLLITGIFISCMSTKGTPPSDFSKEWIIVEKHLEKQEWQSALQVVSDIKNRSAIDKKGNDYYKAVLYQAEIGMNMNEDGLAQAIELYRNEMKTAPKPYIQILNSQLADFYSNYLNNNRYKIGQLTEVSDDSNGDDLKQMTVEQFDEKITELYLRSLDGVKDGEFKTSDFDLLITKGNSRKIKDRNDLKEILLRKALEFFSRPTSSGMKSLNEALQTIDKYAVDSETFVKLPILGIDRNDRVFAVFQSLLKLYTREGDLENYIATELDRLDYIKRNHNTLDRSFFLKQFGNLESLFIDGKRLVDDKAFAMVAYREAIWYASGENPDLDKVYQLAKKCIDKYEGSNGAIMCQNYINSLQQKTINLQSRTEVHPKGTLDVIANTKNLDKLYFRWVKVPERIGNDRFRTEEVKQLILDGEVVAQFTHNITRDGFKVSKDTLEIKAPRIGYYYLVASNTEDFTEAFAVSYIVVSNLFGVRSGSELYVVDRATGAPIQGATVTLSTNTWNGRQNEYEKNVVETLISDQSGKVTPTTKDGVSITFQKGEDIFDFRNSVYFRKYDNDQSNTVDEIYTDRAIYRPGQTVYFKTISLQYDSKGVPSLYNQEEVSITFRDVNYQELASITRQKDEFGATWGSFVIPEDVLAGNFTIQTNHGSKSIKVEQYKRPTYEVVLEDLQTEYQLGEEVSVKGKVKAFAGYNINDAQVTYSVIRKPRWTWKYYGGNPGGVVVANGQTTTDDQGEFSLMFEAFAQEGDGSNAYNYELSIDVVAPSGEASTATENYYIGNKKYYLSTNLEDNVFLAKAAKGFKILAQDINGKQHSTEVTCTLVNLTTGNTVLNKKILRSNEVLSGIIETGGKYKIEIQHPEAETHEQVIFVNDIENNVVNPEKIFLHSSLNDSYRPGDRLEVQLGSAVKDQNVMGIISWRNGHRTQWKTTSKGGKLIVPITREHLGGFQIRILGIQDNDAYSVILTVNVPWVEKELDLKFLTIRDKTKPGSEEVYSFEVKDHDGKSVDGQVMATMYDASLDTYMPHAWQSSFYPTYNTRHNFGLFGFQNAYYREYNRLWNALQNESIEYFIEPRLLSFQRFSRRSVQKRAMATASAGVRSEAKDMMMDSEMSYDEIEEESMANGVVPEESSNQNELRDNLDELVFFYPNISTKNGKGEIKFKMNDALTRWKMMTFVHSKNLKFGQAMAEVETSKELMIIANAPRYLRSGDVVRMTATVTNLTGREQQVEAQLEIKGLNASSKDAVGIASPTKLISLKAGESQSVAWELTVPANYVEMQEYKVKASTANHQDTEKGVIPIFTDDKYMTETIPFYLKGGESMNLDLSRIQELMNKGARIEKVLYEGVSSPVWYAVQSIPYLDASTTSTLILASNLFANHLGWKVIKDNPIIRQTFDRWKKESETLLDPLQQNRDLKSIPLHKTPWVRASQSEAQQRSNIANYFDNNTINNKLSTWEYQLQQRQGADGGFSYVASRPSSLYVTMHIIDNLQKLDKVGINLETMKTTLPRAIAYMDREIVEMYNRSRKQNSSWKFVPHTTYLNWTLMRIKNNPKIDNKEADSIQKEVIEYIESEWMDYSLFDLSTIGQIMTLQRSASLPKLLNSIQERLIRTDKKGYYWNAGNPYDWHTQGIRQHAALLDLLEENKADKNTLDQLRLWLIANKQTNSWGNTLNTSYAIYSLLQQDGQLTDEVIMLMASIGGQTLGTRGNAGHLYTKEEITSLIKTNNVLDLSNTNSRMGWGSVYIQYFMPLSKIDAIEENPLSIESDWYIKRKTDSGDRLEKLNNEELVVGDRLVNRLTISSDRDMDYIHIENVAGAGLMSTDKLSGFQWKSSLGYYKGITDFGTDYFIGSLRMGEFVIEEEFRVTHAGKYSGGLSTISCEYAPSFKSHSKGQRIDAVIN